MQLRGGNGTLLRLTGHARGTCKCGCLVVEWHIYTSSTLELSLELS